MAMVSTASSSESIDLQGSMKVDASSSGLASPEVASDRAPSSPEDSRSGDAAPDREDPSTSSPNPNSGGETQSEVALRSEEYRQLFRLPAEEVLVQDFNCACQESILLQGHMYLFVHYICFYSNIFGFETKKIIAFNEVTCVKRAKTAGIFPNAIEILAGGKKYFFASFLSRDEAFNLIHDGWLEHRNAVKAKSEVVVTEQQDSLSESNPVNSVVVGRIESFKDKINGPDSTVRDENPPVLGNSDVPVVSENDALPSHNTIQQHDKPVVNIVPSSSSNVLNWKLEDLDAPEISTDYTKVAASKFSIPVEEFFRLFFSDVAVEFVKSFHKKCGDKEFRCTSWQPHDKFGHTRNVSFQHPIKIYFGAKFGNCQEIQKFRVYKDSHLLIETSQEISDVPYGDYFTVEAIWDVQREQGNSGGGCILHVYANVAFSKRTVWRGKIVQSTLEECREAYATWVVMAHDLLRQNNLEKQEGSRNTLTQNVQAPSEREGRTEECSGRTRGFHEQIVSHEDVNRAASNILQGGLRNALSAASFLRKPWVNFVSFLNSQSRISQVLIIAFAVILLMQVTIVVLLNRPQHIHVASPMEYVSSESVGWLERRLHFLREEMLMVEARLERMHHEHAVLKAHLRDHLDSLRNQR